MLQQVKAVETRTRGEPVVYFDTKQFHRSLQDAYLCGGQQRKKYEKVKRVLDNLGSDAPFVSLPLTNHGEKRIKHCVKYDLGDGWRLVTRQDSKTCTFLFIGNHDDTEHWLNSRRGEDIGVRDGRMVRLPGTSIEHSIPREHLASNHDRSLIDLLLQEDADHMLEGLPHSLGRKLSGLNGASHPQEIELLVATIKEKPKAEFVRTVFVLLNQGNVDGAKAHIDSDRGDIRAPEAISPEEMISVEDGDEVCRLRIGSPEYESWLLAFEKRSNWQDWFLFLHPEQERVVKTDYSGVSQLSGVSGSGKTCVAVRRAMRLAEVPGSRVLLLTLNRSLAGLLQKLVDTACVDEDAKSRIEVRSLFDIARDLLLKFEPENWRQWTEITQTLGEHVDEIFREYFRQWTNNHRASVLIPLHKSFNARGVSGETYLRDELDWIRSAVPPVQRDQYLDLDRKGRKFPIPAERRKDLIQGLAGWEQKMADVGVIDYLGLTAALGRHLTRIESDYTNVLVDEAQDFGTTELQVVRRLVKPGSNDIFLCGDVAQTVLPKHRSLANAGLQGAVQERIRQNYRNSREILSAAYELLKNNLHDEMFESDDLEILDPRFANFSGSVPVALAAESLAEEIAFARTYAETCIGLDRKTVCVAFAGFSSRDITAYAAKCGIKALNGAYEPSTDRLVFSDLEQTKGYEFDTLIIIGCCDGVLPARDALPEESFRETCKLYVAMTRARKELILSFHGAVSPWIREVRDSISTETWADYEVANPDHLRGIPERLPEIDPNTDAEDDGKLSGLQYCYTSKALGLSIEAQDKLIDLVDGKGARAAGGTRRTRWPNVRSLATELRDSRRYDNLIGVKVSEELRLNLPS